MVKGVAFDGKDHTDSMRRVTAFLTPTVADIPLSIME